MSSSPAVSCTTVRTPIVRPSRRRASSYAGSEAWCPESGFEHCCQRLPSWRVRLRGEERLQAFGVLQPPTLTWPGRRAWNARAQVGSGERMPHQRAAQTRTTSREVNARAAGGGPLPSCRDGARGHGDQSSGGEFGPSLRIIQCGSRKTTLCCLHGLRPITGIVDATPHEQVCSASAEYGLQMLPHHFAGLSVAGRCKIREPRSAAGRRTRRPARPGRSGSASCPYRAVGHQLPGRMTPTPSDRFGRR